MVTLVYKSLPSAFGKRAIFIGTPTAKGAALHGHDALDDMTGPIVDRLAPEAEPCCGQNRRHLAIVDRSALRRECLKLALAQQPRRWKVTDLASGDDLVEAIQRGAGFSVILVGAATCGQVDLVDLAVLVAIAGETPVLVTAECDDPERARAILRAGAKGFLPANHGLKVLLGALERVRAGGSFVPLMLTEECHEPADRDPETETRRILTRRQRDVLALISEGKSNKLIAGALGMSESTVKAHVKQIIRRLHVANRTQAALFAIRGGHPHAMAQREVLEGVL
jgi:DNA-binding NarL/FixJ family response regulator